MSIRCCMEEANTPFSAAKEGEKGLNVKHDLWQQVMEPDCHEGWLRQEQTESIVARHIIGMDNKK